MDHNLEDSLNLESDMGGMDFGHSEDNVVTQEDITLDTNDPAGDMPMEFVNIEEQPIMMDAGNEEIIDFMGDQFTLQEYSVQDDQTTGLTTTVESNQQNVLTSQGETMIGLNFDSITTLPKPVKSEVQQQKFIPVKAATTARPATSKKEIPVLTTFPRQVAIAPKPPKLVQKQYAIAPKPVALVSNRSASLVKKVPITGVIQGKPGKGNTVLAQIGKQFVMMPATGSQKIKIMATPTSGGIQYIRANSEQLVTTKNVSTAQTVKPVMAKVIVQGQNVDLSNQPAVITKILPTSSGQSPQRRFVTMQQKTVPISIANKVLLSPTKQGVKIAKKQQIIALKSPTLIATTQAPTTATKKVMITTNPTQNVILKTTAPPKTTQLTKGGTVQGQRTQLHQINVPGKGIQYIRLVTNSTPVAKPSTKTFVLADNATIIQMAAEKMITGQPPPLLMTEGATLNKLTSKPQQKLVRIAPVVTKASQSAQATVRSSQSLLAPLSPMADMPTASYDDVGELLESRASPEPSSNQTVQQDYEGEMEATETEEVTEEVESKAALRALIAETVGADPESQQDIHEHEIEVEFERQHSPVNNDNNDSMDQHDSSTRDEHPLIVIPSNYVKQQDSMYSEDNSIHDDSKNMDNLLNISSTNTYQSPQTPQALSETDLVSTDINLRPRKACNCTKSQCLKLYCDCFANGTFCNNCNCNNCHNNLENEELRQKAIRGCLERNPNAFRPKIGKTRNGGIEHPIRRHNKGCNCKRSGCLKNYCECYEAKIACTSICKCVGCRNVVETLERSRRRDAARGAPAHPDLYRPPPLAQLKQPCSFMTTEVIEAVCQCLLAAAVENDVESEGGTRALDVDPVRDVIVEFERCLQDIISASHQATPLSILDEGHT